jgi:hypothetical protein
MNRTRSLGRDRCGGQIRKERETSRHGGGGFAGAIQQAVIGSSVQGQSLHYLHINFAIKIKNACHDQENQRGPGPGRILWQRPIHIGKKR